MTGVDSFDMDYMIWSQSKQDAAALGTGKIVCLDYKAGKRVALPSEVFDQMKVLDPNSVLA